MTTLKQLCEKYKVGDWPDKDSVHSYVDRYDQLLAPYRTTAKNILEIGLMSGESLRMWSEYFKGKVYGMDCSLTPIDGLADLRPAIREGYNICIGDASNPADLNKYFYKVKFDVVVEDANHDLRQQVQIYKALKKYMAPGSIYIIEDVQSIDDSRKVFEDMGGEVIDLRSVKGRYDDCLIVFKH